jgi:transcriptional regulator with XRE-family HTH domain
LYNGFDVTKELLYGFIREEFADRGIACLVIDTPGTGEPLRLSNVPSRPDYEVPTTAIVDYVVTRPDIDPERIGLLGISLGGYYAPRGASFERRIRACAAWGGVWDYGAVWQHSADPVRLIPAGRDGGGRPAPGGLAARAGAGDTTLPRHRTQAMADSINEFGAMLRSWRDRASPEEFGLPVAAHRRARGLRRQELARLAGVSPDYLIQLEQGRASVPAPEVLTALGRALRLTEAEREHLLQLAGQLVPAEKRIRTTMPHSVRRLHTAMTFAWSYIPRPRQPVRQGARTAHRDLRRQAAADRSSMRRPGAMRPASTGSNRKR